MMLFPLFWIFTAAQLQRDLHVIGEDVVEVLHPAVQWVPFFISAPVESDRNSIQGGEHWWRMKSSPNFFK